MDRKRLLLQPCGRDDCLHRQANTVLDQTRHVAAEDPNIKGLASLS